MQTLILSIYFAISFIYGIIFIYLLIRVILIRHDEHFFQVTFCTIKDSYLCHAESESALQRSETNDCRVIYLIVELTLYHSKYFNNCIYRTEIAHFLPELPILRHI